MHPRFAPALYGLLLSDFMSLIVSGVATLRAAGLDGGPGSGFAGLWLQAWLLSWAVTFPVLLVAAPVVRRLVARLTREPGRE